MRTSLLATSLTLLLPASLALGALVMPSAAEAQPVVVVGPPETGSGPPSQVAPTVPPGYEVEGQIGGMYFRGRVYAPTTPPAPAPQPAPVAPPAPPPPVMTPPPAPVVVVPAPQPQPAPASTYVVAPPPAAVPPPPSAPAPWATREAPHRPSARERLADDGMGFAARLGLDLVGAGLGVGLGVALGYAFFGDSDEDGARIAMAYLTTAGLAPTAITAFGGAIAGGRGRFGGAMLGEIVGGGLAATLLFGLEADLDEWQTFGVIIGSAMLGSILGIEIQHALRTSRLEQEAEREEGVQLGSVGIAPTAQGSGATLTVGGTF